MADWCGGAIGGSKGGWFCCKEAAKCTIQSHRTQKVALASSTLYLQGPRAGQARLEPTCSSPRWDKLKIVHP
eukprot:scaffold357460_cov94-Attheya_sp.AAC.1